MGLPYNFQTSYELLCEPSVPFLAKAIGRLCQFIV